MSDRTPETIEGMLRDVREALRMDVAFVSKFRAPYTNVSTLTVVAVK